MDQAYFCPVCGYITYESVLTGSAIEKKCLSCGSALQGTGKDHDYYFKKAFEVRVKDGNFPKQVAEVVRKEFYYDNPLFDKEKYEAREQADRERIERNKAGLNPLDNLPKCPTCGSTNLSRLSGVGMITMFGGFGVTDGNAGKTFQCNNCGYHW